MQDMVAESRKEAAPCRGFQSETSRDPCGGGEEALYLCRSNKIDRDKEANH